MTNDEIMREAALDEFLDELKSNRLNESTGFSSVELKIMEAYDFTPFDVLESDKLARRFPEEITPLHEGFGSFIGGLLMKPAVTGAGLNVAIATIIAVAERFLPAGDGILGKIGSFLKGGSGASMLARGAATTIPGILAAAYKVSQDPDYQQAKARHNKAVCRRMMKKAVIAAGLTGIIANVVAAYLISPKAATQLAQAGNEAKAEIGQTGTTPSVDQVAKEVAAEGKLDATETKEVAALAASNGATTDMAAANQIAQAREIIDQKIQGDIPESATLGTGTETPTETPTGAPVETPVDQTAVPAGTQTKFAIEPKPISDGIDVDPKTNQLTGLTKDEQIGANKVNNLISGYGVERFKNPKEILTILQKQGASEEELLGAKKQLYANAAAALHDGKSDINDSFYASAHKSYVSELSKGRDELLKTVQNLDKTRDKSFDQMFGQLASDGTLSNVDRRTVQNAAVEAFDKQYNFAGVQQDTANKQLIFNSANKSYTDAYNAYEKAAADGIQGQGLKGYLATLKSAEKNLNNAEKALIDAQNTEQQYKDMRQSVKDNVESAWSDYRDRMNLAQDINNNQSYLSQLGVGSTTDAANLAHANDIAAKNGIENTFGPTTPTNQPDAYKPWNQTAALAAANANVKPQEPIAYTPGQKLSTRQQQNMVGSIGNILSQQPQQSPAPEVTNP
jgi:hypothetical protein